MPNLRREPRRSTDSTAPATIVRSPAVVCSLLSLGPAPFAMIAGDPIPTGTAIAEERCV